MTKLPIAIIIPGGMGTGKNNIGVPALENVINRLAVDFTITVFQLYKTNKGYQPVGVDLVEVYHSNRIIRNLKFFFAFRRIHKSRRFRLVHGYWALPGGVLAVLTAKLFGLKSVISLQGGDAASIPDIRYGQLLRPLQRRMVLWALHHCHVLISPTRYLIENLKRHGFQRSNVRFIPLGIDTDLFDFRESEIQTPVRFLSVGSLNHVKDHSTLLRAFAIITAKLPSELTIIGEGYLGESLRALGRELDLSSKVTFESQVDHDELPSRYHAADVLLHTSRSEGHPIVAEEAMSCGVLVCGTRVGLLADLPECCVSVEVGDHRALAEAVLTIIPNRNRVAEIKQAAARWARVHSISWTVAELRETYEQLAD